MTTRIWIIEDNYLKIQELRRLYADWDRREYQTLAAATSVIDDLVDEDCVTVDSQFQGDDHSPIDPLAGKRLITDIRMKEKRCRIFWHSIIPLDPDFKIDLGIEYSSRTDLSHVKSNPIALADDVADKAMFHRTRLSHLKIEYFNSLFVALQAFLFASDLDSVRSQRPANRLNLVLEELGSKLAYDQYCRRQKVWEFLEEKTKDIALWFKKPILSAMGAWPHGTEALRLFQREFYPTPVVEEIFLRQPLGAARWLRYSPLGDGLTGDADGTAIGLYHSAVKRLWKFCESFSWSIDQDTEFRCDIAEADAVYRALQLISLVHYPFVKDKNLAKRSVLSHQHLVNRMRVLFQTPGVTETDGGSPARTQAVITGNVPPGVYPEIEEALERWPQTKIEIEQNIESISHGADPFWEFLEDMEEDFDWQWNAVKDLHRECVKEWLGVEHWAALSLSALKAFDEGFDLVRDRRLSIEGLIRRFEEFRGLYSGRDFFNFQQTT